MKTACFIPIKAHSERVKGKNLRLLNGKPLYRYICEHVREADVFDDVYIDTDSAEISEYARTMGFEVIERLPVLAQNTANGNDLLNHHFELHPEYDFYFQLFATAPYMQPETIRACWEKLTCSAEYDSCFPATENHSFYWLAGNPVNYRPEILGDGRNDRPLRDHTGVTQKIPLQNRPQTVYTHRQQIRSGGYQYRRGLETCRIRR